MKIPRFTIRRLMVAVAVVGIVLGVAVRMLRLSAEFRSQARYHALGWANLDLSASSNAYARSEWHRELWVKYERAARHPWLPVRPDPPEPE